MGKLTAPRIIDTIGTGDHMKIIANASDEQKQSNTDPGIYNTVTIKEVNKSVLREDHNEHTVSKRQSIELRQ